MFGLVAPSLLALTSVASAGPDGPRRKPTTLVEAVRRATERFKDVAAAQAAGFGLYDWNPRVSCEEHAPDDTTHTSAALGSSH